MKVYLAKTAGFCFGVDRAVSMVEQAAQDGLRAVTLGPIIHNRHVVQRFAEMGVRQVDEVSEIEDGCAVIIRSHGVSRAVYYYNALIDPLVKAVQQAYADTMAAAADPVPAAA